MRREKWGGEERRNVRSEDRNEERKEERKNKGKRKQKGKCQEGRVEECGQEN